MKMNNLSKYFEEITQMYEDSYQTRQSINKCDDRYVLDGNDAVLTINVTGIPPDEIHIYVTDNVLYVKSTEDSEFKITNSYKLSNKVDISNIKADVKYGLLTLHVPVKPEEKPINIPINVGMWDSK